VFLEAYGKVLSGKSEKCKTCGRPLIFPNAKNIAKELLPKKLEFVPTYLEHIATHERFGMSHGRDIEYPCPNRSTKLILAILVLYYSLQKR